MVRVVAIIAAGGLVGLMAGGIWLMGFLGKVPSAYPPAVRPMPGTAAQSTLGGGLDGFNSPYLGHTGSWNGKGGAWLGGSKLADMDVERAMGLRWTFMPVYWRVMEPEGPVDLAREEPRAWQALDAFIIAAHARGLNVLLQAPVVGGNAGGPPAWAGRREPGKSAPANMNALAEFAGKLAGRYRPGGTLAVRRGWGNHYGVRAWELDNEPESYLTHWDGQAADYAEFATRAVARIKAADAQAVIVGPGLAAGKDGLRWLAAAVDGRAMAGSPGFRAEGKPYSIGPVLDVVSFHNYEGLDSALAGESRTVERVLDDVSGVFEAGEQATPGGEYARKLDYWHTEGNFDFLGLLSRERRAAWRFQFFTRAFAAGLRKVAVMDASPQERVAVGCYVHALPDPFPMREAAQRVGVVRGRIAAFVHADTGAGNGGQVWVVWALAGAGNATVKVPVKQARVAVVSVAGRVQMLVAVGRWVRLDLPGDAQMAAPVLVIDRAAVGE